MTPEQRLSAINQLLATGVMRLIAINKIGKTASEGFPDETIAAPDEDTKNGQSVAKRTT